MLSAIERPAARSNGFTLFEVLIAFFILSVGLVGVVSLQAMSKAAQHQAIQRSRAVALADEILEMIRGNPRGVGTYNIGASALGGTTISTEPSPNCRSAACDPNEMARHDLWAWEQALDGAGVTAADGGGSGAGLLQPHGCIRFTPDTANGKTRTGTVDVVIQWRALQDTSDAVDGGFVCGNNMESAERGYRRQIVLSSYIVDEREL